MKFQATEKYVKLSGRTLYRNEVRFLGYSASSLSFRFVGKRALAHIISDTKQYADYEKAWAAVYVNGSHEPYKRFEITEQEGDYLLYESDAEAEVCITLMKYSEPEYAPLGVAWIETDSKSILPPPPAKKRRLQIIGDSITCGYGVEGSLEETVHRTCTENPQKSYSVLTADALDAELEIVAWNGKGVITQYIGDEENQVQDEWLIPMLYEYTDAGLERDYFHNAKKDWERWEHDTFQPNLIIVNLGTNDASYTRGIPERNEEFQKAYTAFLAHIHDLHPNAAILCMLGTMDQRLCSTVDAAAADFREKAPDARVEFLSLPPQEEADGLGTFWHPTAATQRKTADIVAAKAKKLMNW